MVGWVRVGSLLGIAGFARGLWSPGGSLGRFLPAGLGGWLRERRRAFLLELFRFRWVWRWIAVLEKTKRGVWGFGGDIAGGVVVSAFGPGGG
jgi:hypothetical protein